MEEQLKFTNFIRLQGKLDPLSSNWKNKWKHTDIHKVKLPDWSGWTKGSSSLLSLCDWFSRSRTIFNLERLFEGCNYMREKGLTTTAEFMCLTYFAPQAVRKKMRQLWAWELFVSAARNHCCQKGREGIAKGQKSDVIYCPLTQSKLQRLLTFSETLKSVTTTS